MKARMQLAMMKMDDPRVMRAVMVGVALLLALVAQATPLGVQAVYADPSSGGGGTVGG